MVAKKATIVAENDYPSISMAVYTLANGGIVICPSETCYGILADATNKKAVERVFAIKGRKETKSLSIFISELQMLSHYAKITKTARKLIKNYLPGPLTLILAKKAGSGLAKNISKGKTIAIRWSSQMFLDALVLNYGKPLTATSANLSGKKEIYKIDEIKGVFGNKADLIIDGGNLKIMPPTTIVDCTGVDLKIIRQGKIKLAIK